MSDGEALENEHEGAYIYMIFLFLIMLFIIVGSIMEARNPIFGHESSVIIIAGMLLSVTAWALSPNEEERIVLQFNSEIFFDFLLPAILFAVGFNMRRKEFFKNFANIAKFGVFGTLFTFGFYVIMTKALFTWVNVTQYEPATGEYTKFELQWMEIFLVCSVLVSSDIIAALSILKFDEAPHIYSIIIGEGLFNDVVVIVLYETCLEYQPDPKDPDAHKDFNHKTVFAIIGSFLQLCLFSILVGMVGGFLITYILKKVRSVSHSAVHETFFLIVMAMFVYFSSEVLGQSGITSLVTCALIEAHYTWYNLSPQGKHVTSITFETLGYGSECFVFSFIGLSLMYYYEEQYPWSWQFIVAEFFIIIVGRFMAIVLSYYMFNCCKGSPDNKLKFNEVSFLSYAAFIRGSIAFGLVQNIPESRFP